MKRRRNKGMIVLLCILYCIMILVIITLVAGAIWANIRYANTPVNEIPLWALWLILG